MLARRLKSLVTPTPAPPADIEWRPVVQGRPVMSWRQFGRRVRGRTALLGELDRFPGSVLVAGCQRSGTTALTRALIIAEGVSAAPPVTGDDELDAALVLSGAIAYSGAGRHCFQTTYLNENVFEYGEIDDSHRLVWVVRNPVSVVHSMLYNWERFALDELFHACGADCLPLHVRRRYSRFGVRSIPPLQRAAYAFAGKTAQAMQLQEVLGNRMMVVEYETLVSDGGKTLSDVCAFAGLEYRDGYARSLNGKSLSKAESIGARHREYVTSVCDEVYERVRALSGRGHRRAAAGVA